MLVKILIRWFISCSLRCRCWVTYRVISLITVYGCLVNSIILPLPPLAPPLLQKVGGPYTTMLEEVLEEGWPRSHSPHPSVHRIPLYWIKSSLWMEGIFSLAEGKVQIQPNGYKNCPPNSLICTPKMLTVNRKNKCWRPFLHQFHTASILWE